MSGFPYDQFSFRAKHRGDGPGGLGEVNTRYSSTEEAGGRTTTVTASEAAAYVFCAKAWHLEHVLGDWPSDAGRAVRESGTANHAQDGRRAKKLRRMTRILVVGSIGSLVLAAILVLAAVILIRK